ncbi:MAG: zinc metallopeptidase [Acidobacteriota bacterium]|nr:zinc metallopeptidase [Acidobacteriota bacterium]
MRWEDERESSNVEDARGGGGFSIGGRGAGIGCGGLIVILLVSWLTGINPLQLLNTVQQTQPSTSQAPAAPSRGNPGEPGRPGQPPADRLGKFASAVLGSTEDVWKDLFSKMGRTYHEPRLVLFSQAINSSCGFASAATGPFYCEQDKKVYLDLSFFQELSTRFGASGDFADAYVIAHEVGHHVQDELGLFQQIGGRRSRGEDSASVRIELQADCFAGVWGFHANKDRHIIEPGDFEQGLRAAAAIGDDRIQKQTQGYVAPESFTHGSSQERTEALRQGLESGDPGRCETFGVRGR